MILHERDLLAEIPPLRRYARALTGDPNRADDLVQDTLERALGKWRLWRPGNLRGWLMTMMHNQFVNDVRRPSPIEYRDEDTLPESSVRDTLANGLALRDLDRALDALPPDQREVLLLVGLEDLSYQEVAAITGTPVGTVMSRLSRARTRLRAALDGDEMQASHLKRVK
ncbi:sigma-70 family RNA polymerase sigma factor [Azoarcus sp. L1K30]|uniref:sigma-70 family RNA polymerase sigma factor n=1 Tax=Azoarcus sp. L1K30 TaxID=2820277 RepID=UPI001B8241CD|nr:sigma-70 family RNA polymerase sigma factor [Azoarcus sp. L1K30]MBR0568517.1 sigma-70 family RNA polymerase sigma factor [Azoarcus sp. L1K30]